jgi:hypothetical protein
MRTNNPTILSFGGGVDSSCLAAMDLDRPKAAAILGISIDDLNAALPRFDAVVFADTGAEHRWTYDNVARFSAAWDVIDLPFSIVRRVTKATGEETILEWNRRLGTIPVMGGAKHVCSKQFKGDTIARWVDATFDTNVTFIIGIEANEGRRLVFDKPKGGHDFVHPLVDLGMTREMCVAMLSELGWPEVKKSSCLHCPFKSEEELRDMWATDQAAWKVCAEIEDNFKAMSPVKHQKWIDAGKPVDTAGRALRGMWRMDSWKEGRRLFVKKIGGNQLTVHEWAAKFEAEAADPLSLREVA